MQYALATDSRKKALVISHERSGTHFLMNTLASAFGYVSVPWVNLDFELGINFHDPLALRGYFERGHDRYILNIVKSHHPAGFYAGTLDYLLQQFHCFYIHRHPAAVMESFHRLVCSLPWHEGPKVATAGEFMRAEPCGALLRYQKTQHPSMLARWRAHVEGWLEVAESAPGRGLIVVRYEDLDGAFADTVRGIGERIGMSAQSLQRPVKDHKVVRAAPLEGATGINDDDRGLIESDVGELLRRMGW
jgi:hypothetical protein